MESLGTNSPHRLGRYQLGVRLAVGGMAEVWLARQDGPANFQKQLVVKKILPQYAADPQFVEMFLNEARLAALLDHPNVVQIFELGEERGTYYLVMEFIHGRNLRVMRKRCLERGRAFPFEIAAHVMAGACEGLHSAHEMKDAAGAPLELVHRDVSPDNILVSFDGQPKVVDFGIAKAFNAVSFTQPGTLKGKYAYMSPEQALGKPLDRRADVYSAGVVLYELLSGRKPFPGQSQLEVMRAILEDPPPDLGSVRQDTPAPLVAICARALAKKREDRYPDARSMGLDLQSFLKTTQHRGVSDAAAFMDELFRDERDHLRQMGLSLTPAPQTDPSLAPTPAPQCVPSEDKTEIAADLSRPRLRPQGVEPAATEVTVRQGASRGWARRPRAGLLAVAASALLAGVAVATWLRRPSAAGMTAAPPIAPPAVTAEPAATGPAGSAPTPGEGSAPIDAPAAPVAAPLAAATPPGTAAPTSPTAPTRDASAARPRASPKPSGPGRLVIRVNPWAAVSVDGKALGVTPLAPLQLPAGRHRVMMSNSDLGKTRTVSVEVKPGRDAEVRVDLFE